MLETFSGKMAESHLNLLKCSFSSMRSNWLYVYQHMTKQQGLTTIEQLPEEDKAQLKKSVKEIAQGSKLTVDQMVDLARCLYTIEYFLHEKSNQK